jgi:hypothetical protein
MVNVHDQTSLTYTHEMILTIYELFRFLFLFASPLPGFRPEVLMMIEVEMIPRLAAMLSMGTMRAGSFPLIFSFSTLRYATFL